MQHTLKVLATKEYQMGFKNYQSSKVGNYSIMRNYDHHDNLSFISLQRFQ